MLKLEMWKCLSDKLVYPNDDQLQQRGIADKIEQSCNAILKESFTNVVSPRSRRSIEDISVNDCYVDHKTTDVALDFKMPNLISIDRLKELNKPLLYNFIKYDSNKKEIQDILILDVYELNWDHLAIQNLGKGQLQIKNMASFLLNPKTNLTKEEWKERLKVEAISFYQKLIVKTEKRLESWL